MTASAVIRPRARQDIREIADYIGRDNRRAAERFIRSVEETAKRVAESPDLGNPFWTDRPELADLFEWAVRGFERYRLFFRRVPGGIVVVRVIHGARDLEGALS